MNDHKRLDASIDEMDSVIGEMSEADFEKVISGNSAEAFALRRARKNIRYRLYRIQTAALGGPDPEDVDNLKERFEAMPHFGGWRNFAKTWDVDMLDPFQIVHRDFTVIEEWEALVRNKFPIIEPGGKVTYPDIAVKKAVEEEAVRRKAEAKKTSKPAKKVTGAKGRRKAG